MTNSKERTVEDINREISRKNQMLAENAGDFDALAPLFRELALLQDEKTRLVNPQATSPTSSAAAPRPRQARKAQALPPDGLPARWGEPLRGMPNDLIRSGLFNIRREKIREQMVNATVATFANARMFYNGEELRIRDEDVMMQIFHFQQSFPLGETWQVNGRDFLKQMHWSDGQRGYVELYTSLLRLSKGHLTLARAGTDTDDIVIEAGAMLSHVKIDHRKNGQTQITIAVNHKTLALWESMGYTLVNWDQRLQLNGPLARYLHRLYSSFGKPHDLKVSTLHKLSGSTTASMAKFTQILREALEDLVEINFLRLYWIKDGLVHVERMSPGIAAAAAS